jgi:hypothetical protein
MAFSNSTTGTRDEQHCATGQFPNKNQGEGIKSKVNVVNDNMANYPELSIFYQL